MLLDYLDRLSETEQRGDAREESFYPCLLDLLTRCAKLKGRRGVHVTMIPKKAGDCLLDFQVWHGGRIAGYVEAKKPGTDLTRAAGSDQLLRYRATFPNLLLTNFRELRLYRGDDLAGRADTLRRGLPGEEPVLDLIDLFLGFSPPPATSAAVLARQLAERTRILAGRIHDLLDADREGASELAGFHKAFCEYLLAGLTFREFADLYAQTIAYGLLTARWQTPEGGAFDRRAAAEHIPRANGILHDAFQFISLGKPPDEIGWIVDDVIGLLASASVRKILESSRVARGGDPILHFYETFLAGYDGSLRKKRGVYYTPRAVVSYVVRSVHRLLESPLGRPGGLANREVTLLDPAAGTLTFLVEAMRCAVETARAEIGGGSVPALTRDHLLRDFYAFELMMAPYAMGHLQVSLILEEIGHPLEKNERFPLYLTNALEREELKQTTLPGAAALSRESHDAARVKNEQPILVVLGNPPWSGHSANRGRNIDALIREPYTAAGGARREGYLTLGGDPLGEKNSKWLQDDYVKFLRFAQRKVDETGEGIVAFVTNHGWLDNPTFRGLRRSLLETFDEIRVLDLHGNANKRERAPDGGADGNVFEDVMQGVAVAFLVKKPGLAKKVLRADLWGSRREKLGWLLGHDVTTTPWAEAAPEGPGYLFSPRDAALAAEYRRGVPLPEIFPAHSAGIVTGRDAFVIDRDLGALRLRIAQLRSGGEDELFRHGLRDTGTWKLAEAWRRARADEHWDERFADVLYRPFDSRFLFYADYLIERPRKEVMGPMLAGRNLGLVVPRQSGEEPAALVTDTLAAHKAVSAYDVNTLFPLYLRKLGEREPNVAPDLLARLARDFGEEVHPVEVLNYVYAVLWSGAWRKLYAAFLREGFPRIPFPKEAGRFLELAGLGAVLVDLHLLRSDRLARPAVRFEGEGSGKLAKSRQKVREYLPAERRVVVNEEGQSFSGIAPEAWACRIGGYPVLDHWLADRAGCGLRYDEIEHFRKTAAALGITEEVRRRIDGVGVGV
jgi:hypothetical protein